MNIDLTTITICVRTVHYVDSSAVSQSRKRLREKMASDEKRTQKCDTIVKQLIEMSR